MYDDYVKHPLATVYNAVLQHSIYSFDISVERAGQYWSEKWAKQIQNNIGRKKRRGLWKLGGKYNVKEFILIVRLAPAQFTLFDFVIGCSVHMRFEMGESFELEETVICVSEIA